MNASCKVIVHKDCGETLELQPNDVLCVDAANLGSKSKCKARIVLSAIGVDGRNEEVFVVEPAVIVASMLVEANRDNKWGAN